MTKSLKPEDYPLDTTGIFKPTKIYFLHSAKGFATTVRVVDVTSSINSPGYPGSITEDFRKQAEAIARQMDGEENVASFTLSRKAFYSTNLQLHEPSGKTLAELAASILPLGTWTLVFPPGSPHSSHNVEMKPVGIGRKEDIFVKDSIAYFWDMDGGKKHGTLYKVVEGKRVRIAEFAAKYGFKEDYVFVLDDQQLDEVVGVASCVALLNRMDSFQ